MKNQNNKSGNIFASIKIEEEKEKAQAQTEHKKVNEKPKSVVDPSINNKNQVESATKKPETLAKNTESTETAPEAPQTDNSSKLLSNNPGVNYLNPSQNMVDSHANNGILYIVPTKKKTRSHRKGFLLSDLALQNLQNEAAKYEISENELINQILEKML